MKKLVFVLLILALVLPSAVMAQDVSPLPEWKAYDEFIKEAQNIFTKYEDNGECNKDNKNLVYENDQCIFADDKLAHGGYKCSDEGKWSSECKKTYCDFQYFYNKLTDKCEIDP